LLVKNRAKVVAVTITAALMGLTACGVSNPREQQGSAIGEAGGGANDTVQLGLLGIMSDAPIVMADKDGYFKKFGVSVHIQNFDSGGDMVAPMSTGQLDVGGGAFSAGLMNSIAEEVRRQDQESLRSQGPQDRHRYGRRHRALRQRDGCPQEGGHSRSGAHHDVDEVF
jgi:hypothetical protein